MDYALLLITIVLLILPASEACSSLGPETKTSTADPQNITSPDFGTNYPNNQDCRWQLKTPTVGEHVCLRVVWLNIEGTDPNCGRSDYLRIFDGAEIPLYQMAELCGTNHNGTELCSGTVNRQDAGNFLTLHFHSDSTTGRPGFLLLFWTNDSASSTPTSTTTLAITTTPYDTTTTMVVTTAPPSTTTIQTTTSTPNINSSICISTPDSVVLTSTPQRQNFISPGYSNNSYPINAECRWKLSAPDKNETICIQILDLDIEGSGQNCERADYLHIYDGDTASNLITGLCGNNPDSVGELCSGNITHDSNFLTLAFHSDGTFSKRGFRLEYWTLSITTPAPTSIAAPMSTAISTRSSFSSAPVTTTMPLATTLIPGCCSNHLQSFTLLSLTKTQNVTSPNYTDGFYPNDTDCHWTLQAPLETKRVCVELVDLDIQGNTSDCKDYLRIFNGTKEDNQILVTLCGRNHNEETELCSTGSSLTLHFHSGNSSAGRGFLLQFWTSCNDSAESILSEPFGCENNTVTLNSTRHPQNITFPDYAGLYHNNAACKWMIEAPTKNQRICLKVIELHIEGTSPNCSDADYLSILDGDEEEANKLAILCGDVDSPSTEKYCSKSKENTVDYLRLHFHSDCSVGREGFRLQYWSEENPGPSKITTIIVISMVVSLVGLALIFFSAWCLFKRLKRCSKLQKVDPEKPHDSETKNNINRNGSSSNINGSSVVRSNKLSNGKEKSLQSFTSVASPVAAVEETMSPKKKVTEVSADSKGHNKSMHENNDTQTKTELKINHSPITTTDDSKQQRAKDDSPVPYQCINATDIPDGHQQEDIDSGKALESSDSINKDKIDVYTSLPGTSTDKVNSTMSVVQSKNNGTRAQTRKKTSSGRKLPIEQPALVIKSKASAHVEDKPSTSSMTESKRKQSDTDKKKNKKSKTVNKKEIFNDNKNTRDKIRQTPQLDAANSTDHNVIKTQPDNTGVSHTTVPRVDASRPASSPEGGDRSPKQRKKRKREKSKNRKHDERTRDKETPNDGNQDKACILNPDPPSQSFVPISQLQDPQAQKYIEQTNALGAMDQPAIPSESSFLTAPKVKLSQPSTYSSQTQQPLSVQSYNTAPHASATVRQQEQASASQALTEQRAEPDRPFSNHNLVDQPTNAMRELPVAPEAGANGASKESQQQQQQPNMDLSGTGATSRASYAGASETSRASYSGADVRTRARNAFPFTPTQVQYLHQFFREEAPQRLSQQDELRLVERAIIAMSKRPDLNNNINNNNS